MKTDKFEKTIRQKLESVSPDFQESDWAKMQNYMHTHTPPTFWQQYGSWLGYAAAASVTTVMALLYTSQLSQNNQLRTDVKGLQSQIEAIQLMTVEKPRTDTVYIVRTETIQVPGQTDYPVFHDREAYQNSKPAGEFNADQAEEKDELTATLSDDKDQSEDLRESSKPFGATNDNALTDVSRDRSNAVPKNGSPTDRANNSIRNLSDTKLSKSNSSSENVSSGRPLSALSEVDRSRTEAADQVKQDAIKDNTRSSIQNRVGGVRTLGTAYESVTLKTPLNPNANGLDMQSALLNRLSPKQVRKTWMAATARAYKATTSDKKAEQVTQAENIIPKLNIKLPYRFGVGLDWQKGVQNRTITGEIIVAKKLSISTGVSWVKLKQMEFFTEKIFREANKTDFKQSHSEVPKAFVVTNIKVAPTMVQMPVAIAFRNELKDDWAYYAGTGVNITLNSKEAISYTCLVPNPRQDLLSQSFERKMDISPINSVNFSFGLEKSWHPIVVQAEGYIYSYFKPLNPLHSRSGPGVRIKLLYQIGKKI
jgi:hypothetical protein